VCQIFRHAWQSQFGSHLRQVDIRSTAARLHPRRRRRP
jgi:hypothetical protein